MNKDEQIKALAELDEWKFWSKPHFGHDGEWHTEPYKVNDVWDTDISNWAGKPQNVQYDLDGLPPYLTSRDAIIPVIEKQIKDWKEFTYVLNEQVMKLKCRPLDMNIAQLAEMFIKATPQQLSEALLRATGRWQETK